MYVCICNAVTEDAVHQCLAHGARNSKEVKERTGMKPGCGSCTKRLCAMVSEWRTASELMDAMTGGPAALQAVTSETTDVPPLTVEVGADQDRRVEEAA
ncbi:(2Fe-2S)-binding protein [Actinocorallia longicatena]|uniref:Bacterioferritin-associated ferredoxin n=1 Tax=Actinocorallia longicatena TaxID=111803 RepID=A0ABP6QJE1_9ACTN